MYNLIYVLMVISIISVVVAAIVVTMLWIKFGKDKRTYVTSFVAKDTEHGKGFFMYKPERHQYIFIGNDEKKFVSCFDIEVNSYEIDEEKNKKYQRNRFFYFIATVFLWVSVAGVAILIRSTL